MCTWWNLWPGPVFQKRRTFKRGGRKRAVPKFMLCFRRVARYGALMEWLADRGKEASAKAAHLAAEKGSRHALRALAEQCGDKVLTAPRVDGSTPAHGAALNGQVDVLRFLGERCGREVWMAAAANGDTPAHCAAQKGHVSVLRFLCEAGDETALTTANVGGLSPSCAAEVACGAGSAPASTSLVARDRSTSR